MNPHDPQIMDTQPINNWPNNQNMPIDDLGFFNKAAAADQSHQSQNGEQFTQQKDSIETGQSHDPSGTGKYNENVGKYHQNGLVHVNGENNANGAISTTTNGWSLTSDGIEMEIEVPGQSKGKSNNNQIITSNEPGNELSRQRFNSNTQINQFNDVPKTSLLDNPPVNSYVNSTNSYQNRSKNKSFNANGLINPPSVKNNPALTLCVENIPISMKESLLRHMFGIFGTLTKLRYIKSGDDKFKGWCFAQMQQHAEVKRAYRLLNDTRLLLPNAEILNVQNSKKHGRMGREDKEDPLPASSKLHFLKVHLDRNTLNYKTDEDKELEELNEQRTKEKAHNKKLNETKMRLDNQEILDLGEVIEKKLVTYSDTNFNKKLEDFIKEYNDLHNEEVREANIKSEQQMLRRERIENEILAINQEDELVCIGDIADARTKNENLIRRRKKEDLENEKIRSNSPKKFSFSNNRSNEPYRPGKDRTNFDSSRRSHLDSKYGHGNRSSYMDYDRERSREKYDRSRESTSYAHFSTNRSLAHDELYNERRQKEIESRQRKRDYEDKLRSWTIREERKRKEWLIEDTQLENETKDIANEAKKLYDFFKDYKDIIMDKKYYSFEKYMIRLGKYNEERKKDEVDRGYEKEEIKALKEKFEDENQRDPIACVKKIIKEAESSWKPTVKALERPSGRKKLVKFKEIFLGQKWDYM